MEKKEIKTALINIKNSQKNISKGKFRLFFFVADSKGTPIGSLAYTYELAYKLKQLGYDVRMLYAENEFVGVKDWLGEKYSSLPHFNTSKDNVDISPSDFLFIPELFSNVMSSVKKLPCKKIAILQSFNFLTELIPYGVTWEKLGIYDCITTSSNMKDRLLMIFPKTKVHVIRPSIDEVFQKSESEGKLLVNIISKDQRVLNSFIKPFKWMFPIYNFVTFRYINGRSREEEAKYLSEGSISIWFDTETDFGYSALEAMACGNIVIGKIPENNVEWMFKDGELRNNGVWCYTTIEMQKALGSVIQTMLYDNIPQKIYDEMESTLSEYTNEKQVNDLKEVLGKLIKDRTDEFSVMIDSLEKTINNLDTNKSKK